MILKSLKANLVRVIGKQFNSKVVWVSIDEFIDRQDILLKKILTCCHLWPYILNIRKKICNFRINLFHHSYATSVSNISETGV